MQVSFAQSSKAVLDHVVWVGLNTPSIHKRCVIYPEQKDIVFTTLLTLRKIAHLPKDIENRILAYILRDQVSPGKILSHFLQGSQKSDLIKSILTHIGITVDQEVEALKKITSLQSKNDVTLMRINYSHCFKKIFRLFNTLGQYGQESEISDARYILAIIRTMIQKNVLPTRFLEILNQKEYPNFFDTAYCEAENSISLSGKIQNMAIERLENFPDLFFYRDKKIHQNCEQMYLHSTYLVGLPLKLSLCTELKILDLCNSPIAYIPYVVSLLLKLEKLYIDHTVVSEVPEWMSYLPLTQFHIEGTNIKALPVRMCNRVESGVLNLCAKNTPYEHQNIVPKNKRVKV